ncbi:pentapeptide repeat-containing protein [Paenibacillus sp. MER TA 81-3]|uniref:pentapeptide repeat-containing protein n=1 Tax=Paenibacillus sp. MER TA 81-3 TaxID=2939573 RepID=UPI00203D7C2D|nr:pentapeptide repeat-containing protein [Paenibacillus sp. MER TA 81-3]MCM3342404.1 pentapeptide repeat-containing protein [Paenibacillus sp. MER TA 81-3]
MTRDEALRHWQQTAVTEKRMEQMLALHQLVMAQRDRLADEFTESFKRMCVEIRRMQDQKRKGKIKFIQYAVLRNRLLSGDHSCRICAYDGQWYGDAAECAAEYDAGWVLAYLDEFERYISAKRKMYVGKILPADVASIIRKETVWYMAYMIKLARYAVKQAVRTDEFAAIDKEDELYVHVGEYKDRSELVYRHDSRVKDSRELREMFSAGKRTEYVYEVFSGLDFSGMYFKLLNFSFADFSESMLAGNLLWGCAFIGADFSGANLEGADLNNSIVHGASFRSANLRNCKLEQIQAGLTFPTQEQLHIPPFMETSFAGANLEEASFKGADVRGADFRGAMLKNTGFADAHLEGATFLAGDVKHLDLSEAQLQRILIVEA